MPRNSPLTSLPQKLEMGLNLLERGQLLRSGGKMPTGKLPAKVIAFFNRLKKAGIEWVMIGAEALNLYRTRPRATVDVDIVVRKKHLPKVKKIVRETCREIEETEMHFRGVLSQEPNRLEVDVIKSQSHELFEAALDKQVLIADIPVPRLEVLLALKFLAAVSPWRSEEDKLLDISDFIKAFKENRPSIDRVLLVELAARAHKKARKEFERFLTAVENNEPMISL